MPAILIVYFFYTDHFYFGVAMLLWAALAIAIDYANK